jgi:hypothetical protein
MLAQTIFVLTTAITKPVRTAPWEAAPGDILTVSALFFTVFSGGAFVALPKVRGLLKAHVPALDSEGLIRDALTSAKRGRLTVRIFSVAAVIGVIITAPKSVSLTRHLGHIGALGIGVLVVEVCWIAAACYGVALLIGLKKRIPVLEGLMSGDVPPPAP